MKNALILLIVLALNTNKSSAQNVPTWTHDMNNLPDTANLFPVRTLNDASNNIYVLSNFQKAVSAGVNDYKVYLRKYNEFGVVLWTVIYDNNGNGKPKGYDLAIDNSGNCYVAGAFMATQNMKPLLLKVSSSGNVLWLRDSTSSFNSASFDQVIFKNNKLFLKSIHGIARFNLNGTEEWVTPLPAGRMVVDNAGQVITTTYFGNPTNIVRLDANGVINFSAVSINADRLATDSENSFYLLSSYPQYELVKFDSAGIFQWSNNNFPVAPPFGDIGFEVLTDFNNDVIAVGLSGYMYKFTSSGTQLWSQPIFDLDNYLIAAKISYNNFIAIAGTSNGFAGYDMKVALFNLNGDESWSGYYNSNNTQEFTVDFTIDNSGVYVIEDSISNTLLAKFESPFLANAIDYSLICVSEVEYDTLHPELIHITVYNGNLSHLNYPSVQLISPTGDTISNIYNLVNFFAHISNQYQTYTDTITVAGITDFSNYSFLISEGFGDTTVSIGWCPVTGIKENAVSDFSLYPNPANAIINIQNREGLEKDCQVEIFNMLGSRVLQQEIVFSSNYAIDVSNFTDGVYLLRLSTQNSVRQLKFIKQ